jgi:tetratricopeptide (TPR) repeat protein
MPGENGVTYWQNILALLEAEHTEGLAHTWDVYLSWIAGEALKNKNYSDAFSCYAKAIGINPDNPGYQAGCGASYFHLGDYKNDAEYFGKALILSKSKLLTSQFLAARGSAFFSLTKYNEAAASFTQAIEEAGQAAPSEFYLARASAYEKLNMADKIRGDLELAEKAPKTSGDKIRGIPLPGARSNPI